MAENTASVPPTGGKIFTEAERKSMMAAESAMEEEEGSLVADVEMTDAQPSTLELEMMAAARETEARVAEEKERMAREDKHNSMTTPPPKKSATAKAPPPTPKKPSKEKVDAAPKKRKLEEEFEKKKKTPAVKRSKTEQKKPVVNEPVSEDDDDKPLKPKPKKKRSKPTAVVLTEGSAASSDDEEVEQPKPKKAKPKKIVQKKAPKPLDESDNEEDSDEVNRKTEGGYAVSDEPYRFGVSKIDELQIGVGRRDSDIILKFFHSSAKGKFASDHLIAPFGNFCDETMILYPSTRMKMGQQITFGCKDREAEQWRAFYDVIAEELKPYGRLKVYDDGSLFRIRAQLARDCEIFYAEDPNNLNSQDVLTDITGNYVHHSICGRMSLLKGNLAEGVDPKDGSTVTWIYLTWVITHLLVINRTVELPPIKVRPMSEAKPRGRQAQLRAAANGTPSIGRFFPVTWQS